jgi:hypothetical protein
MYIPKSKQKQGGKPEGNLIDPKTGLKFAGKFVQDYLGNFFKGDKVTSKSVPLELVPFSDATEAAKFGVDFVSSYVSPPASAYDKGTYPRFFAKDSRTGKVIEMTKERYDAEKKEKKLYRRTLRIEWYVTGNPEDEIINGYLYPGTKAKNQDVINQAEQILPGIGEQILKDPAQFVK